MAKKLHYFNTNGLAEGIRYILYYSGDKFEDIRYEHKDWPVQNLKDILPFGQVPLYEEGDRKLNQSIAIARYVGGQNNLVPSDLWEQALLDAAVQNILDFFQNVGSFIVEKDPAKKRELKKTVLEEKVDYFFSRFEKQLKVNNGHFGKKLSWADFVFVGIIECSNMFLNSKIEDKYPSVKKLTETIHSLPGIKEYVAKREPYNVPLPYREANS